jgi:probable rRNA maturation factor
MTTLHLDIQRASTFRGIPTRAQFETWLQATLRRNAMVTVRIVDLTEGSELNRAYRGKDYPTNVLTFVYSNARGQPLHGDIVLCAPVVRDEARAQNKRIVDHFAHLTVHGALHLLGLDHVLDADAERMEGRERRILQSLGIADPYERDLHA